MKTGLKDMKKEYKKVNIDQIEVKYSYNEKSYVNLETTVNYND